MDDTEQIVVTPAGTESSESTPDQIVSNTESNEVSNQPKQKVIALNKLEVLLKPIGSAQRLAKSKYLVTRDKQFSYLSEFLKKQLKFDKNQSLFLYVKQTFAPALDTEVGTVYDCFGSDNRLVVHYCATEAWG